MIELKKVYDFYMLQEQVWIGAVEMITFVEHEKTTDLTSLLEEIICETTENTENEQAGVEE